MNTTFLIIFLFLLMKNMDISQSLIGHKIHKEDICLADSATTHTILKDKKYFLHLIVSDANVNTISGSTKLIKGSGRVTILLPKGTNFIIDNALFSMKSQRNLLSFKDIRRNGYHIETVSEKKILNIYVSQLLY